MKEILHRLWWNLSSPRMKAEIFRSRVQIDADAYRLDKAKAEHSALADKALGFQIKWSEAHHAHEILHKEMFEQVSMLRDMLAAEKITSTALAYDLEDARAKLGP